MPHEHQKRKIELWGIIQDAQESSVLNYKKNSFAVLKFASFSKMSIKLFFLPLKLQFYSKTWERNLSS